MKKADFVHLHNHSEYSLLDGAFRLKDIVKAAKEMNMEAVALTDHGNMFGAIPFYKEAKAQGVKPIIGMEAYVARGRLSDRSRPDGRVGNNHLTLLVKDEEGYRNLIKLSSIAYLEGFYYKPRVDLDLLEKYGGGLVAMSGCLQGGIPQLLLADRWDEAKELAGRLSEIFGPGGFYLEIQNHGIPEELDVIPKIAKLSSELGIPLVATNDCHFWKAEDHEAHDALLCLQTGKFLDDERRMLRSNAETYFKSPEEMKSLFGDYPEAIETTLEIAEKCNFELKFTGYHLPEFPIPKPFKDADEYLKHLVDERLHVRFPEVSEEVRERLRYELDVISRMNFSGYFLVVWDIVNTAREMSIPVGPGRGSAAGSLVCYVLGITSLNPLEHGLIFERLLNPERVSMPDIDVDFSDDRRQEVIEYVIKKYGSESVCQIITFGSMAKKAVVRDVGRVMRIPLREVDKVAKMIQVGSNLREAIDSTPELKKMYDEDPKVKKWMDLSLSLEGLARHASTHAAGIVITPTNLIEHVPLFRTNKGEVTTQYEMKILEEIGILKIDILGLKTLSQIDRTIKLVEKHKGIKIDIENVPLDDEKTFELLRSGRTVGIFQLESSGMQDLLRKMQPSKFEDIVAVNALYRPGPLGSDMVSDFIECKHGRKKVKYEDPRLEPILRETYGVILYQEQVMKVASELAGFTLGQADLLRRAMGKKKPEVMEKQREIFVEGAVERGMSKKKAKKIFDLMANFAGYGFNKSHSAAYALVTMRTAYLKAHYPAAFMAATLTSDMGDTNRLIVLLDECRNMGLFVQSPDVNVGGVGFDLSGDEITYGLAAIKNVGAQTIKAIVEAREAEGPFKDLLDFCDRVDLHALNKRVLENLIQSGAMDRIGGSRAQMMANIDRILAEAQRRQKARDKGQVSLGFFDQETSNGGIKMEVVKEWDEEEKMFREKESLGFYFSGHPLDRYRGVLERLTNADSRSLANGSKVQSAVLLGLISRIKTINDRKGNPMAFITMEDLYGSYEVVAFSDCFKKYRSRIQEEGIVIVRGKVSARDEGPKKIIADEVYTIEEALGALSRRLVLTLSKNNFALNSFEELKAVLSRFKGEKELILHLKQNGSKEYFIRAGNTRVSCDMRIVDELKKIRGVENVEFTL